MSSMYEELYITPPSFVETVKEIFRTMHPTEKYGFLLCLFMLLCFALKDKYEHVKHMKQMKIQEKDQRNIDLSVQCISPLKKAVVSFEKKLEMNAGEENIEKIDLDKFIQYMKGDNYLDKDDDLETIFKKMEARKSAFMINNNINDFTVKIPTCSGDDGVNMYSDNLENKQNPEVTEGIEQNAIKSNYSQDRVSDNDDDRMESEYSLSYSPAFADHFSDSEIQPSRIKSLNEIDIYIDKKSKYSKGDTRQCQSQPGLTDNSYLDGYIDIDTGCLIRDTEKKI